MRIVEPWIKVEKIDGIQIMKKIEKACRTCYRSEGMVSEESYKNLLKKQSRMSKRLKEYHHLIHKLHIQIISIKTFQKIHIHTFS